MNDERQQAKYLDGIPQNLEAAASDALEWLRLFQDYCASELDGDGRKRLRLTIETLRRFLPDEPMEFETTPEAPLYGAVAEVVISGGEQMPGRGQRAQGGAVGD